MEKKLYPLKFFPIASRRPWGGTKLSKVLGKKFFETDKDDNEVEIGPDEIIGESWEIADMGGENDSIVENGFLAGNALSEVMETYMERIVGDKIFYWYGKQFPLLVKFLDIENKLSVQVHPDDTDAAERYDSLGKTEVWYVIDADPDARIYMGFSRDVEPSEFYEACKNGTADKLLNVIHPKKGDVIRIQPGTVHAADGGILVCEIQESSDLTFRLYDWGRELNPKTAREMHLEEAFDLINFKKYDSSDYTPAGSKESSDAVTKCIADFPQFTVSRIDLHDAMQVSTEVHDSFVIYCCIKGEVSLQMKNEEGRMIDYRLNKGESILVPAECEDFILAPLEEGSVLLESIAHPGEEKNEYIDESVPYTIDDTKVKPLS